MKSEIKLMKAEELGMEINREFILKKVLLCIEENDGTEKTNYISAPFEDMRMYYRVIIDDEKSFKVSEKVINALGIDINELWKAADKNTRAKIRIENLGGFLLENKVTDHTFTSSDPHGPFILSNTDMVFGASAMIFTDVIADICNSHGVHDYCYVLPSSIHEVLICFPLIGDCKKEYDNMVTTVNSTEVAPNERLAWHSYIFDVKTQTYKY